MARNPIGFESAGDVIDVDEGRIAVSRAGRSYEVETAPQNDFPRWDTPNGLSSSDSETCVSIFRDEPRYQSVLAKDN